MNENEFEHIIPTREDNQEASALPDIRDQVPDIIPYLLPHERVVYVKKFESAEPTNPPSSLVEIRRLVQAGKYDEIGAGDSKPVLASLALEGHGGEIAFHRFEALFGRDSLRVAIDLIGQYPKLAHVTLLRLAELQGVTTNPAGEEEPGRIIHEYRDPKVDPVAQELTAEMGWEWPYYGAVDSTPEFIRTMYAYCLAKKSTTIFHETYQGRDGKMHNIGEALQASVDWILRRCQANPEGLLEFKRANPNGLENQVWRDSYDAYFHEDGSIANHTEGIASVGVQRVAYDALLDAAELYEDVLGWGDQTEQIHSTADNLRKQILEKFWTDEKGGYFVLGTDRDEAGQLRQLKIRTSDMGHLLHSRLLEGDDPEIRRRREAVITQIFSPQMLNVSGVRTLASDEKRFRPGSYHNGSVWLWDTYFISKGLELHGYYGLAEHLRSKILNVVNTSKKFPEFARGDFGSQPTLNTREIDIFDSQINRINRIEQPPQEVQAWSVAAILAVKIKNWHQAPTEAKEPSKRAFELEILSQIKR